MTITVRYEGNEVSADYKPHRGGHNCEIKHCDGATTSCFAASPEEVCTLLLKALAGR